MRCAGSLVALCCALVGRGTWMAVDWMASRCSASAMLYLVEGAARVTAELARAAMYTCAAAAIASITGAVVLGLLAGRGQRRRRFVAVRGRVIVGSGVVVRGALGVVLHVGEGYFGYTYMYAV